MMEKLRQILSKHWGYHDFLPLQKEAMGSLHEGRDCIVVLPTGGGKSLCYQAPALALEGMAVVVSPLISLMKDQVDALTESGIAAVRLDSSVPADQQGTAIKRIQKQDIKLLYLSPERLLTEGMIGILRKAKVSYIAVDEAHCVSMWGHDFRPEYRQLGQLKDVFGKIPVGAYTATATEQVRRDIARQLRLDKPVVLVGSFDRPNLTFKVFGRQNVVHQVCSVLDRHKAESGIVYCIRRKDVDAMCEQLISRGYRAAPYHAGMDDSDRKKNQDLFMREKVDTIVATIAFGMGIDKSNVRYVIHTGMPKSLEHYQQESGRAGRDGLEAECCLFYSAGDFSTWKYLMRDMPKEAYDTALIKLEHMAAYCSGTQCRHQAIVSYFGQTAGQGGCSACDVCLGEMDYVEDALVTAQKILSCILRLGQNFGGAYTSAVLVGSTEKRILENGHDRLSTYGLLESFPATVVQGWINQLAGQGFLERIGQYNVLQITEKGRGVLKGLQTPRLLKPAQKPARRSASDEDSWKGVDRELFEVLRKVRSRIAAERGLPAYVVLGDVSLRDIARRRPSTPQRLLDIKGIGDQKCRQYGKHFVNAVHEYCQSHSMGMDAGDVSTTQGRKSKKAVANTRIQESIFAMFDQGHSVLEAARRSNRAVSTTVQYLAEYIQARNISTPVPWIEPQTFRRICRAFEKVGTDRLKPVFDELGGTIGYDEIRIALACFLSVK